MKKLFFLTAIVSLLFVGCNNDNGDYDPNDPSTETVRLLPSKWISSGGSSPDTIHFLYDNLNRLETIELWRRHGLSGGMTITYNVNDNPITTGGQCQGQFRYSGNFVFAPICTSNWNWSYDTLTIGIDGRLDEIRGVRGGVRERRHNFSYSSNGNLMKITRQNHLWEGGSDTIEITYSNVRSIWRHINIPKWFLTYVSVNELTVFPAEFACKRMMPSRIRFSGDEVTEINFAYRLDANGYVVQMDETRTSRWTDWDGTERIENRTIVHTIEWIPAR